MISKRGGVFPSARVEPAQIGRARAYTHARVVFKEEVRLNECLL